MKYDKSPVHPEKINLINKLLSDPTVNEYYNRFVDLNQYGAHQNDKMIKDRNDAFELYAKARDKFLGLKPLK